MNSNDMLNKINEIKSDVDKSTQLTTQLQALNANLVTRLAELSVMVTQLTAEQAVLRERVASLEDAKRSGVSNAELQQSINILANKLSIRENSMQQSIIDKVYDSDNEGITVIKTTTEEERNDKVENDDDIIDVDDVFNSLLEEEEKEELQDNVVQDTNERVVVNKQAPSLNDLLNADFD